MEMWKHCSCQFDPAGCTRLMELRPAIYLMLPLFRRTAIINAQAHFRIDPVYPCYDATAALCQEASRVSTFSAKFRISALNGIIQMNHQRPVEPEGRQCVSKGIASVKCSGRWPECRNFHLTSLATQVNGETRGSSVAFVQSAAILFLLQQKLQLPIHRITKQLLVDPCKSS